MKKQFNFFMILFIAVFILNILGVQAGCVGTYEFFCGDTINESCIMNSNLTTTGTCFTIGADDILIDGNGYWITGNDAANTYGILTNGYDNLTIKNFIITDFDRGIFMNYSDYSNITDNIANSNANGFYFSYANNNSISRNSFTSNSNAGIGTIASSDNNFTENNATSNTYGISIGHGSTRNNVTNNLATSNTYCFEIINAPSNNFFNNTADRGTYCFYLWVANTKYNNLTNNIAKNCTWGISFASTVTSAGAGANNTLVGNNITTYKSNSTRRSGIYVGGEDLDAFRQSIDETNTIDEFPVKYYDGYTTLCPDNTEIDIAGYSLIGLVGCNNVTISSSTTDAFDYLLIAFTNNSLIENINTSSLYSYYQYTFNYAYNCIANNLTADSTGLTGLAVIRGGNNSFENSTFIRGSYGIYFLPNSNNNSVINNLFERNYNPIYSSTSGNNIYLGNILRYNQYGINLRSNSSGNTLRNNIAYNNTNDAFLVHINGTNNLLENNTAYYNAIGFRVDYSSTGNILANNTAYSNSVGIECYENSWNNTFYNNTLYSNSRGFSLYYNCSNNLFDSNTLYDNNNYGIAITFSSVNNTFDRNIIYDNDFSGFYLNHANHTNITNNFLENNSIDFSSINNSFGVLVLNTTFKNVSVNFSYSGDLNINYSDCPSAPADYIATNYCLNATNFTEAWLYLNISYNESQLNNTMNESTMLIWRYNGTNWSNETGTLTKGVNITGNFIFANITTFSIFSAFGTKKQTSPGGGSRGGGGGTRCGDGICNINEDCTTCPQDCGNCSNVSSNGCGNDLCELHESYITCPEDCQEPESEEKIINNSKKDNSQIIIPEQTTSEKPLISIWPILITIFVLLSSVLFIILRTKRKKRKYYGYK